MFAALLLGMAALIGKTRLRLLVRAVTQNRRMAAGVGVNTARIAMPAFALGAGSAGLAGCALSQLGIGRRLQKPTVFEALSLF